MAKAWLAKNAENNRRPKLGRIEQYARDIRAGKWQTDTGECIKFDTDGRLIDGQNRCHAVILADMSVEILVAYDVPADAMFVMDTGASRTHGDIVSIAGGGHIKNRPTVVSIVRWSIMWDNKDFLGSGAYKPTSSEVMERYLDRRGHFDAMAARGKDCANRGLGIVGACGMAFHLFSDLNDAEAKGFFDQYIFGASLPEHSPILTLRNRMAGAKAQRLERGEQLALFMRAWNAFRADEPLEKIVVSKYKLTNANFPQPK